MRLTLHSTQVSQSNTAVPRYLPAFSQSKMALTAYGRLVALSCLATCIHALPLDAPQASSTSEEVVVVTQVVTSSVEVFETSTIALVPVLPTPPPSVPSTQNGTFPLSQPNVPASSSVVLPPQVVTDIITITATSTLPPATVTISLPPTTITQTITTTPSSSIPSPSNVAQTIWSAPAQMTDLSSFGITSFAYGADNMAIVDGLLSQSNTTTAPMAEAVGNGAAPVDMGNLTASLRLFYPAGSINPESEPQGGADFYATPLDISKANNVTLEYSVFFPTDFDWVLAGKLPGIYGGHRTCSGGDDAKMCFSTRLMWRENGAGELYLVSSRSLSC